MTGIDKKRQTERQREAEIQRERQRETEIHRERYTDTEREIYR